MDSITHIALGACIGEALLGKKLGRRAMLLGAASQSLPDIDFVASFWLDTAEDLLAHRGFTHSLLFALIITPVLALLAERWHRPHNINLKKWNLFFGIELLTHLFLDAFNNYGVGWFEPFSHLRVSFHTLYVADPFFTLFPLVGCMALLIMKRTNKKRHIWWKTTIIGCALYLGYSINNKFSIDRQVNRAFVKQNIPHEKYFTTPAPLQNILWMVVAGDGGGFHVGFRSLLDSREEINFQYFPMNDSLLDSLRHHEDVAQLVRFSQGFYTVEKWNDTLVFNDLRFGQIIGWQEPREKFVFHYFLQHPDNNELVVQRGRFAKWDKEIFKAFLVRIIGN